MFLKEFSISVEDMQSCLYFNPEESVIQKIKRNWSESDCCPVSLYLHPNIGDVSWHHTANSYMETVFGHACVFYIAEMAAIARRLMDRFEATWFMQV